LYRYGAVMNRGKNIYSFADADIQPLAVLVTDIDNINFTMHLHRIGGPGRPVTPGRFFKRLDAFGGAVQLSNAASPIPPESAWFQPLNLTWSRVISWFHNICFFKFQLVPLRFGRPTDEIDMNAASQVGIEVSGGTFQSYYMAPPLARGQWTEQYAMRARDGSLVSNSSTLTINVRCSPGVGKVACRFEGCPLVSPVS
jgi:hypothetical protein